MQSRNNASSRARATCLRHCVRADDLVGRLGGDEFAILASTDEGLGIDALTDRVLETLRQPIWVEGGDRWVAAPESGAEDPSPSFAIN